MHAGLHIACYAIGPPEGFRPIQHQAAAWGQDEAAGLPDMRLYDLRHTAATLRLVNGEHPKVVQEMLGHASITLTMDTYSHVLPGMQEESAARLDALLAAP